MFRRLAGHRTPARSLHDTARVGPARRPVAGAALGGSARYRPGRIVLAAMRTACLSDGCCFSTGRSIKARKADMDPVRVLPYWPAAMGLLIKAGQMTVSGYAPTCPKLPRISKGLSAGPVRRRRPLGFPSQGTSAVFPDCDLRFGAQWHHCAARSDVSF